MPPYTAFPSINQQSLPSKRGDTSYARSLRKSEGSLLGQGYPQKCPQEIFGEEEKPQGGPGRRASLVCPPASARFDEVSDPRNP